MSTPRLPQNIQQIHRGYGIYVARCPKCFTIDCPSYACGINVDSQIENTWKTEDCCPALLLTCHKCNIRFKWNKWGFGCGLKNCVSVDARQFKKHIRSCPDLFKDVPQKYFTYGETT